VRRAQTKRYLIERHPKKPTHARTRKRLHAQHTGAIRYNADFLQRRQLKITYNKHVNVICRNVCSRVIHFASHNLCGYFNNIILITVIGYIFIIQCKFVIFVIDYMLYIF